MSKKKKVRKKSYQQGLNQRDKEIINKLTRSIWIRALSFKNELKFSMEKTFSTFRRSQEALMLTTNHVRNRAHSAQATKRYADFIQKDEKFSKEATLRASRIPQPWPFVVIALQTDGDKIWYDHITKITDRDYLTNSKEYKDLVDDVRCKVLNPINDKYLMSIGVYIFNDRTIDFEDLVPQLVDDMIEQGGLNKAICLLGAQKDIRETCPEYYEEIEGTETYGNLGKLLKHYYLGK